MVDLYIHNMLHYLKLDGFKRSKLLVHFIGQNQKDEYGESITGYTSGNTRSVHVEIFKMIGDNPCDFKYLMITLGHEMIHAKQYFKGELRTKNHKFFWKGEEIDETIIDWEDTAEFEIEAYEGAELIYEKCFPAHPVPLNDYI
jgi:hypothetical protein